MLLLGTVPISMAPSMFLKSLEGVLIALLLHNVLRFPVEHTSHYTIVQQCFSRAVTSSEENGPAIISARNIL